jgi:hypothetical protein
MKTFKQFLEEIDWEKKQRESGMFRFDRHNIDHLKKHEYGNRKMRKVAVKHGQSDPSGDEMEPHHYTKLKHYEKRHDDRKAFRNLKPGKHGVN